MKRLPPGSVRTKQALTPLIGIMALINLSPDTPLIASPSFRPHIIMFHIDVTLVHQSTALNIDREQPF